MNAGSPLNSEYWDAQPSFSTKNNVLYFSSNRPNGKGQKDIWKAKLMGFREDGSVNWSEPEMAEPYSLYGLTFPEPRTGWAVGDQGTILKISSAGS